MRKRKTLAVRGQYGKTFEFCCTLLGSMKALKCIYTFLPTTRLLPAASSCWERALRCQTDRQTGIPAGTDTLSPVSLSLPITCGLCPPQVTLGP